MSLWCLFWALFNLEISQMQTIMMAIRIVPFIVEKSFNIMVILLHYSSLASPQCHLEVIGFKLFFSVSLEESNIG